MEPRCKFSLLRFYALIRHITNCSDRRLRLQYEGKLQRHADRLNKMLEEESK